MIERTFDTQFRPRVRFRSAPGSGVKQLYSLKVSDLGVHELVPTGTEDLYGSIQSHADSVDIHVLLRRYNNGEVDVLNRVQGAFGNFTDMPKTYAELLNRVIDGERMFNELPVDVRARFNHSFAEFLVASGEADFAQRLGVSPAEKKPVETSENPVEEVKT